MPTLVDRFGRTVTNLRISVTDRCNFRCRYCMPAEGMEWLPKESLLTFEELARVARIIVGLGVSHIRLTGGEPLMRRDLWKLVRQLRSIEGITDIALTTNGYFLQDEVDQLVAAGLHRVNISLDGVERSIVDAMARRECFDRVWNGIEAAVRAGLNPIKLNVVLIRGVNDGEILKFARLARTRQLIVRFIEFMPIGKDDGWSADKVVTTGEIVETIRRYAPLVPVEGNGSPAQTYVFADGGGEIGFISAVSHPFCADCDRVRLTADGKFRTCLFSLQETDLRALLRGEVTDEDIAIVLMEAVRNKEEGHLINRPGFERPARTMNQIGG